MKKGWNWLFGAVAMLIVGCAIWSAGWFGDDRMEARSSSRRRNFTVGMTEGLSVRRHGYYGIDFVRCGKCRVEKRKVGGFSIGCFNDLVLEDLSVVIPPELRSADSGTARGAKKVAPKEMAAAIGVDDSFLKSHGGNLRFSGLRVVNLSVATLDASSNAVPRFVAESGVAKQDGLHLLRCGIIQDGQTNCVGRAVLKPNPSFRLEWSGGEMAL